MQTLKFAIAMFIAVLPFASSAEQTPMIFPVQSQQASPVGEGLSEPPFDLALLDKEIDPAMRLKGTITKAAESAASGAAAFEIKNQGDMYGMRFPRKVFVGPETVIEWDWKKTGGKVCVLQLSLRNLETGAYRVLGYGAGSHGEGPSNDPTIEVFVGGDLPREWTHVKRNLAQDIKALLDWDCTEVTDVHFAPWDAEPVLFSQAFIRQAYPSDVVAAAKAQKIAALSAVGKGDYVPPRLKKKGEMRELVFDTAFEETAPGRNSAQNEWSAFGAGDGNANMNNMGHEMRVRYPLYDLVFRMRDGEKEIAPGELESFRLGLVAKNLPAIWGGWEYNGLLYKVSVMTVPMDKGQAWDLYKIEIQNITSQTQESLLLAGIDGPPDMRLDGDKVTGTGGAPYMLASAPTSTSLLTREWGLCDKRAKSYASAPGPGITEEAFNRTRIGLEGVPVTYRFKAETGKKYSVYLGASPHISGLIPHASDTGHAYNSGDMIFQYEVEGCAPQKIDWRNYIESKMQPICVGFDGAADTDGDGYIQVQAGAAAESPYKHSRLSAIYVFAEGFKAPDVADVYSGSLNSKCVYHFNVGITPELDWANQAYDMSDVGLCRMNLAYQPKLNAGETKTFWIKVPPIHRRQPVSMGSVSHAFREVLPGEAVPSFDDAQVQALRAIDPQMAEKQVIERWRKFEADAAQIRVPDAVMEDIYLSRLATRAICDERISDEVWFNTCSPWNYYDFAYRDQAYVIYAYDLAGMHDRAAQLLRCYWMEAKDVPKGPIAFGEKPLQLGISPDGLWLTRAGQFDGQGQNLWCMVQHYKLSGDRKWLEGAYPFIRRGAQWLVDSRQKHMLEIKDPNDPRYGLIQPGAMEVGSMTTGMHHYYMDAWAILGMNETADAAGALGLADDEAFFHTQARGLKASLMKSFEKTFRRKGLYQGHMWFGVENEGEGMYGFWGQTPFVWPTRAVESQNPMLNGTWKVMERMANLWGGGLYSDSVGGCWPYITVDWAISYILRGEPDKTVDFFCAFTDTAGLTYSWGEGYSNPNNASAGDQPHFWADAQWVNLYRHLFVMEDGATLQLAPALLRRWQASEKGIEIKSLPTEFGDLDLTIKPADKGKGDSIDYTFTINPKGDQSKRTLEKIILSGRVPDGRKVSSVSIDGKDWPWFAGESIIIPKPERGKEYKVRLEME